MEKELNDILNKINTVIMSLNIHPDNEQNSEFEDMISNLEEVSLQLKKIWNIK